MAAVNVGVTAIRTDYNDDFTLWKSVVEFVASSIPSSVTTLEIGDQTTAPTMTHMTEVIASFLGVATVDVTYVNPSTV